jgi:hypothetical protein
MINPTIDFADGNGIIESREMTQSEYAEWLETKNKIENDEKKHAEKEAARQAVLAKLGLTAEEAQALLG